MATNKRFAAHSHEEILEKRSKVIPDNTKRSNYSSARILKEYLTEKGQNPNFEDVDAVALAEMLSHFYMDIRTKTGEQYKTSTLENIRHSLNRYLKSPPYCRDFDIIKDPRFSDANESFKTSMLELKAAGKGETEHKQVISESDREKLYSSIHMNINTPYGLSNKVQFDIRFYFFRRGVENMDKMKKSTFALLTDPETGLRFVQKNEGELTKNHRDDKESFGGIMMEQPGSPFCPVTSFAAYTSKLHPDSDRLWQYPRESFCETDYVWYCLKPIGKNTLASFMKNMSKRCGLSQIYTNHCIRATGATILTRDRFASAQIMSVTGHKSVSSLAVYQRVSNREKMQMSHALSCGMRPSVPAIESTSVENTSAVKAITSSRSGETSLLPISPGTQQEENQLAFLEDLDLNELFCDYSVLNNQANVKMNHTSSMFQNCTIQNVNVIVRK